MHDTKILRQVLDAYGIAPESIGPGGGTAGSTWRIAAEEGEYFVRRRGARTSSPARVTFDHGLRKHLAERGYPTVAPLETRDGRTWVTVADAVFEVYPFVEGAVFSRDVLCPARKATAAALVRLHDLAQTYTGACEDRVPQFTSYPVPIAPRDRFDHPEAHREAVEFLVQAYATPGNQDDLRRARERIRWVGQEYSRRYHGLQRGVTHSDYNCFNLLFSPAGEVVGVFDFDWAWREVRLLDIAQGMFFFGTLREGDFDPASIWSLTRCPRFDLDTMLEFVLAYHAVAPLTRAECDTLSIAMLARWISWRMEGAMKVPEDRRAEFFLYGFFEPFEWYEQESDALRNALISELK